MISHGKFHFTPYLPHLIDFIVFARQSIEYFKKKKNRKRKRKDFLQLTNRNEIYDEQNVSLHIIQSVCISFSSISITLSKKMQRICQSALQRWHTRTLAFFLFYVLFFYFFYFFQFYENPLLIDDELWEKLVDKLLKVIHRFHSNVHLIHSAFHFSYRFTYHQCGPPRVCCCKHCSNSRTSKMDIIPFTNVLLQRMRIYGTHFFIWFIV